MSVLGFALGFEGCPDDLIAEIETADPIVQDRLMPVVKRLEAIWAKPQPLSAHIAQAVPIIEAALPDIKAVAPTIAQAISFAMTKV